MISAEVVPFLILAIGVDNMFLIARAIVIVSMIVTLIITCCWRERRVAR